MLQSTLGAIGLTAGVITLNRLGPLYELERALEAGCLMLSAAAPMVAFELYTQVADRSAHNQTSAPLISDLCCGVLVRSVGIATTWVCTFGLYWALPLYHSSLMSGVFGIDDRPFTNGRGVIKNNHPVYHNYFRLIRLFLDKSGGIAGAFLVVVSYLVASEFYLKNPKDGFWQTGRIVVELVRTTANHICGSDLGLSRILRLSRLHPAPPDALMVHVREQVVRGFFGPLIFCSLCNNLPQLHFRGFENYMAGFGFCQNVFFSFDLCFAAIGYTLPASASVVLRSGFQSVEPTTLGWVSTMICYDPLFRVVLDEIIGNYSSGDQWHQWFDQRNGGRRADHLLSFRAWGVAILMLQAMFAWCTVCFGLRYSNLSYRTVVTYGPYYFTKHPAYIAKLVSFAMLHVPWIDLSKGEREGHYLGLRHCLSLCALTGIYYVRARTEEMHLSSASEDYRAYMRTMDARWSQWWEILGIGWGRCKSD